MQSIVSTGPNFGLHLNLEKCEFFDPVVINPFLNQFFKSNVVSKVKKVLYSQSQLIDLNIPQVALHLLRSCLSICKINHLLHTVVPGLVDAEFSLFDDTEALFGTNYSFFNSRFIFVTR